MRTELTKCKRRALRWIEPSQGKRKSLLAEIEIDHGRRVQLALRPWSLYQKLQMKQREAERRRRERKGELESSSKRAKNYMLNFGFFCFGSPQPLNIPWAFCRRTVSVSRGQAPGLQRIKRYKKKSFPSDGASLLKETGYRYKENVGC